MKVNDINKGASLRKKMIDNKAFGTLMRYSSSLQKNTNKKCLRIFIHSMGEVDNEYPHKDKLVQYSCSYNQPLSEADVKIVYHLVICVRFDIIYGWWYI